MPATTTNKPKDDESEKTNKTERDPLMLQPRWHTHTLTKWMTKKRERSKIIHTEKQKDERFTATDSEQHDQRTK